MFTLEESMLLRRMIRTVAWALVVILLLSAGYIAAHRLHRHHTVATHPPA